MHTPDRSGPFKPGKLVRLLRVDFDGRAIGIGNLEIAYGTMWNGFAIAIGQAERNAWPRYAISQQDRFVFDQLRVDWRIGEVNVMLDRLDQVAVVIGYLGDQAVVTCLDADPPPYCDAKLAVAALFRAIIVERIDRSSIDRKFNLLTRKMFEDDADGFDARVMIDTREDETNTWLLADKPVAIRASGFLIGRSFGHRNGISCSICAGSNRFCTEIGAFQTTASPFDKT